jgi:hypothetical protein
VVSPFVTGPARGRLLSKGAADSSAAEASLDGTTRPVMLDSGLLMGSNRSLRRPRRAALLAALLALVALSAVIVVAVDAGDPPPATVWVDCQFTFPLIPRLAPGGTQVLGYRWNVPPSGSGEPWDVNEGRAPPPMQVVAVDQGHPLRSRLARTFPASRLSTPVRTWLYESTGAVCVNPDTRWIEFRVQPATD